MEINETLDPDKRAEMSKNYRISPEQTVTEFKIKKTYLFCSSAGIKHRELRRKINGLDIKRRGHERCHRSEESGQYNTKLLIERLKDDAIATGKLFNYACATVGTSSQRACVFSAWRYYPLNRTVLNEDVTVNPKQVCNDETVPALLGVHPPIQISDAGTHVSVGEKERGL